MTNLNKTWEPSQEWPALALWVEKGVIRNGFVPNSKPEVSCFIVNIFFPTIYSLWCSVLSRVLTLATVDYYMSLGLRYEDMLLSCDFGQGSQF
jgi:hypothetical protein